MSTCAQLLKDTVTIKTAQSRWETRQHRAYHWQDNLVRLCPRVWQGCSMRMPVIFEVFGIKGAALRATGLCRCGAPVALLPPERVHL